MNIYKQNGFADREGYLYFLAEDYDLACGVVWALAELLGPSEDFDGLVNACQDQAELEWDN